MNPKLIIFSVIAVVLVIFVSGCVMTQKGAASGVVGFREDYPIGKIVDDIPFVSMDGKQKTFRQIRQPISIVAFVETPGIACCRLLPELVTLADNLKYDTITVAQVSLPTDECTHGLDCTEICNINDAHLISLCDKDRIAWNAYYEPKPNTVFLIDERSKIVYISPLDNLQSVAEKASELEDEYQKVQERMYGG